MRRFKYISKEIDPKDGQLKAQTVVVTEEEVLRSFYQQWLDLNVVGYRPDRIAKSQCLEDWVALHNAIEIKEDE